MSQNFTYKLSVKVLYYYNGINVNYIRIREHDEIVEFRLGMEDKSFIAVYVYLFNIQQTINLFIQIASWDYGQNKHRINNL